MNSGKQFELLISALSEKLKSNVGVECLGHVQSVFELFLGPAKECFKNHLGFETGGQSWAAMSLGEEIILKF